jgi:hypothetical protein
MMRTHPRPLPVLAALAAALLLAASAATVLSCGKGESNRSPIRNFRNRAVAVNVIVTYDPKTNTAAMVTSDKEIELSFQYHDFVQWASPDGLVNILTWNNGSPFDKDPAPANKVLISRPSKSAPKDTVAGDAFDYTAELVLFTTGAHVPIKDPRIVIMP